MTFRRDGMRRGLRGFGGSRTPAQILASFGLLLDERGQTVSSWTNQGTAGGSFTQASAPSQPTAGATINGKPTLLGDGAASIMASSFNASACMTASEFEGFIVGYFPSLPSDYKTVAGWDAAPALLSTNGVKSFSAITALPGVSVGVGTTSPTSTPFGVLYQDSVARVLNFRLQGGTLYIRVDYDREMSISAPNIAGSLAVALNLFANYAGTVFANAGLACVALTKTALSVGARSAVLGYLASKYATNTYGSQADQVVKYKADAGDSITASGLNGSAWREDHWTRGGATWLRPVGDIYGLAGHPYKQDISVAHGGWTTVDITSQLASGLIKAGRVPCDIGLLMAGTNDMGVDGVDNPTLATRYGTLLDGWQAAAPGVPIYCQKLTLRDDSFDAQILDFNANYLPTVISSAVGRGVNAFLDDTFFTTPSFQYDPATGTLHPTTAHTIDMGDRLFSKLCTWLSEPAFTPAPADPAVPSLLLQPSGVTGSPVTGWSNDGYLILGGASSYSASGGSRPTLTTVDGQACPTFDGAAQYMTLGPTPQTLIKATGYGFACVFQAKSLSSSGVSSSAGYDQRNIITNLTGGGGGNIYPFFFTASGIGGGHYDGADKKVAPIGISLNTTYVAIFYYDGTTIHFGCNGTIETVAAGSVNGLLNATQLALNFDNHVYWSGVLCCLMAFSHNPSRTRAANLSDIDARMRARFPSAIASGF